MYEKPVKIQSQSLMKASPDTAATVFFASDSEPLLVAGWQRCCGDTRFLAVQTEVHHSVSQTTVNC